MRLRPPRATLTVTLFPYTTLFRALYLMARENLPNGKSGSISAVNAGGGAADSLFGFVRNPKRIAFPRRPRRSKEHTSELQSLMRITYAVFCLNIKTNKYISRVYVVFIGLLILLLHVMSIHSK